MSTSQNRWAALDGDSTKLYTWTVPAKNGAFKLRLRGGSAGFLLCHMAMWMSEHVEDATLPGVPDDWGYAFRAVRGFSTTLSNHSSGTACDLNATRHPLGKKGTFTKRQAAKIRGRLHWSAYRGAIRWGGDYHNRKDEMHFEINAPMIQCERVARKLMRTTDVGRRLLAANPSQKAVILS